MRTIQSIRKFGAAAALAVLASASAAEAQCTGDCSNDGSVTVDEIIIGVNIGLGTAGVSSCLAFDSNGDGQVTVDEIVTAVSNALSGCPVSACGDGKVDFAGGETCDDGNTEDGDACPADCRIEECTPTGSTVLADVAFTAPSGTDIAALTLFVKYPDGTVRIPGSGNDASVLARLQNLPEGISLTPNDIEYALRMVAFTPDFSPIAPGPFTTIEFDTCEGAALPTRFDFECVVEDAADTGFNPVSGATCGVTDVASTTPVCGDGVVDFESGETCDDGNAEDGDACPADCRIESCTPSGETITVDVAFDAPAGSDLAAITALLLYPDGVVRLPGNGNDASVQGRITPVPFNIAGTPNDLDYALRYVAFTPDLSPIDEGGLYSVEFDICAGANAPDISAFTCVVEDAADTGFNSVSGATCAPGF
jgi:cysteine-rich repeat protein